MNFPKAFLTSDGPTYSVVQRVDYAYPVLVRTEADKSEQVVSVFSSTEDAKEFVRWMIQVIIDAKQGMLNGVNADIAACDQSERQIESVTWTGADELREWAER